MVQWNLDGPLIEDNDMFEDSRQNEVDINERVYDGKFWEVKLNGSIELTQWDMFKDESDFLEFVRDNIAI